MKHRFQTLACIAMTMALLGAGCGGTLNATNNGNGEQTGDPDEVLTEFTCEAGKVGLGDNGDGSFSMCVDATSYTEWVYFNLTDHTLVEVTDPLTNGDWDIAFRRFYIKTNGGDFGTAGVEVSALLNGSFESETQAPASPYFTDVNGDANHDNFIDHAFTAKPDPVNPPTGSLLDIGWFTYNLTAHVLSPRTVVYFVHATDGSYFKIEILDYYDPTVGTDGFLSLRFAPVLAP